MRFESRFKYLNSAVERHPGLAIHSHRGLFDSGTHILRVNHGLEARGTLLTDPLRLTRNIPDDPARAVILRFAFARLIMPTILNDVEVRVLGALIEKQVTTPEYYPLTLNALVQACNQKNNRNPITAFDEATVAQALESLREKTLTYVFYGSNTRVPKYKHVTTEILHLDQRQLALMCVLMLRGSQTIGELRERASRLYSFSGLEEVQETLDSLISIEQEPLVAKLPRQPGQKEARFAHLLAGEPSIEQVAEREYSENRGLSKRLETDRVSRIERDLETLSEEVRRLQQQFEDFKTQFE
jgi:uncharacterized protein